MASALREAELADAPQLDHLDDAGGKIALQLVEALLADAEEFHLLAVGDQAPRVVAGQAHDGGVEGAAQAALGGADHEQMNVVAPGSHHQRRAALASLERRRQIGQHPFHALGIGAGGFGGALRAPELRRRHHLHGLGDLLRRLHGCDAVAQVFQRRHGSSHAKALANLSTAAFSLSPVSLEISLESRIDVRMSGCSARM